MKGPHGTEGIPDSPTETSPDGQDFRGDMRPMLTIDQFEQLANDLYDRIPELFFDGLSGGIIISEHTEQRDLDLPDVYVLGEYVEDEYGLGRYIVLYYGSFAALFAGEPRSIWEEELWETMMHEIRHHVESLAGVHDLDVEDERQLAEFRRWTTNHAGSV